MTTDGHNYWLRLALNQIYQTSPSPRAFSVSDNSNGDANACISDDGKITVNENTWTREEYIGRGAVPPSSSQTLRIGDFMAARPTTSGDNPAGVVVVAASYEVIRQPADPNKQSRIFAHILVSIGYDPKVQRCDSDDGRRIMTIDEERWEGTLDRSQPQSASSGTGN